MSGRRTKSRSRLFVALDPPDWVRHEAAVWARDLARGSHGMRPVPARFSHVTLAFLGDREESEVPLIAESLQEAAAPVSGLSLGAPVWLPRRRPRALALEVHDDRGELTEMQGDLARSLREAIGWQPEHRHFRPHLTVERLNRGADPRSEIPVSPAAAFDADAITLYRSRLTPEGAEYDPLDRIRLTQYA